MRIFVPSALRSPHFFRLWAGQAMSMFGSLIGGFAFDMVAILTLHASAIQLAVLNGCMLLPPLLAGPTIGVWTDRLRRRQLLIAADLLRAAVLLTVPVAFAVHMLSMTQLYLVAVAISILKMLFDVSFRAYLPTVLEPPSLVQGNSVLQGTAAVAEAGGFALGGLLVQLLSAPLAILFDVASFLMSAAALMGVRRPEAPVRRRHTDSGDTRFVAAIAEGVTAIRRSPVLRAVVAADVAWDLVGNAIGVVITLFFVHDLGLQPLQMGPLFGIGGVSAFVGAVVCGRVVRRWGVGRTMIGSMLFNNIGGLVLVLAGGPLPLILFLVGAEQTTDGGRTIYEINALTILQRHAPRELAGRVFATYDTLRAGASLLGLVLGGIGGQLIGYRPVLILAFLAEMFVPLLLVASPVRNMRRIEAEEDGTSVAV